MNFRRLIIFAFQVSVMVALPAFFRLPAVQAQERTMRSDTLDASSVQPFALAPFVVPGSVALWLDGVPLDSAGYRIDYRKGLLWLNEVQGNVLVANYRVLRFQDIYRRNEPAPDGMPPVPEPGRQAPVDATRADLFGNPRLERRGSITRGVLAGNTRNVSIESGLRLQLAGEVARGVNLRADLTDENTPIQPEGTTQRLSEFDRVSIALQTTRTAAELGDFELRFAGSEFGRITRKLQGGTVSATALPWRGGTLSGQVAGAVSRGIFRAQSIRPIEGVQGPYRLEGQLGEQFVIVVAGTEVVYLDGRRLVRGQSEDYTIDYQTGEITFTPRTMITAERRILVEFQYRTSEYDRTLVGARSEAVLGARAGGAARARLGAVVLREADSRRFNAELGLTSTDSLLLAGAGDGLAARSGAEPVTFDPEAGFVQYVRRDTVDALGRHDSIYVAVSRPPMPGEPVYRVRFSRVGAGQGSYVRSGRVNGIQYEWTGPGTGEYEAIRVLPAPRDHRLVSLFGEASPVKGVDVFGEWSRSGFDLNRFSTRDAADDVGQAYRAGFRLAPLPSLQAHFSRRSVDNRFRSFDRIREVEFERRWNLGVSGADLPTSIVGRDERTDEAFAQWQPFTDGLVRGEYGTIELGAAFSATRRAFSANTSNRALPELAYLAEYITSRDSVLGEKGAWFRQSLSLRKPLVRERLTPYVEFENEDRRQRRLATDSLRQGSFRFYELRPGIQWNGGKVQASTELEYRQDREAFGGILREGGHAWTFRNNFRLQPASAFFSDGTIGYRIRRGGDARLQRSDRGESVVIRWNTRYSPLQRAVEISSYYEALTERMPVLQEVYVMTGPEYAEAGYVWEDVNGDGVLQVDEFLPESLPNEGTYARVFVPGDSLVSTIGVQGRLRLNLEPARLLKGKGLLENLLRKVTSRTTIEVVEKSRDPQLARIYLLRPDALRRPGTTMNGRLRLGHEVSLFRFDPRYGVDVMYNETRMLTELAGGQESRMIGMLSAEGRYRFGTSLATRLRLGRERNRTDSRQYASRRYDLTAYTAGSELTWTANRSWQLSAGTEGAYRTDAVADRKALVAQVPLSVRYSKARRFQWNARVEPSFVQVRGEASGLALYELTEGRGPGRSLRWSLNGDYTLSQYLRATLVYDGRDPQGRAPIHTLRLQMTATF